MLAVEETSTTGSPAYWFFYDANGNVGQVLSAADQSIAARYEYDPYGNIIGPDDDTDGEWLDDAGPYAWANPFRFSTKWLDTEMSLCYYGYRYYSPRLGRWGSQDPLHEIGTLHLLRFAPKPLGRYEREFNVYAYLQNSPCARVDPTGLAPWWHPLYQCLRFLVQIPGDNYRPLPPVGPLDPPCPPCPYGTTRCAPPPGWPDECGECKPNGPCTNGGLCVAKGDVPSQGICMSEYECKQWIGRDHGPGGEWRTACFTKTIPRGSLPYGF